MENDHRDNEAKNEEPREQWYHKLVYPLVVIFVFSPVLIGLGGVYAKFFSVILSLLLLVTGVPLILLLAFLIIKEKGIRNKFLEIGMVLVLYVSVFFAGQNDNKYSSMFFVVSVCACLVSLVVGFRKRESNILFSITYTFVFIAIFHGFLPYDISKLINYTLYQKIFYIIVVLIAAIGTVVFWYFERKEKQDRSIRRKEEGWEVYYKKKENDVNWNTVIPGDGKLIKFTLWTILVFIALVAFGSLIFGYLTMRDIL